MTKLGDRLLILIIAATGLIVLVAGWAGGLVEAELGGWLETGAFGLLALLVVGILIGIWFEFNRVD